MLGKTLFVSFDLFLIFVVIKADDVPPCIDAKPVEKFNSSAFSGLEFVYKKTEENGDVAKKACFKMGFIEINDDNKMEGHIYFIDKSNKKLQNTETAMKFNLGSARGSTPEGDPVAIIGTDYQNWSIILTCDVKANKRIVWILTEKKVPDDSTIFAFQNVINQYDINQSELSTPDQSACPAKHLYSGPVEPDEPDDTETETDE